MPSPEALLEHARTLLRKLRVSARRAVVLELTGTPKAGKTSTLNMLEGFFKAAGFRVSVLRERAAECPLLMKGHFFFNAWTTATMLAEVLESVESDADLLFLDRGFLDALIWLDLQHMRSQVSREERDVFTRFVVLERWRSLVDHTILMKVDPHTALAREFSGQLIRRAGTLMNERALGEFNAALDRTLAEHGGLFSHTLLDASSSSSVKESCVLLLAELLPILEKKADPEIAVIPRPRLDDVLRGQVFLSSDDAREALARMVDLVVARPRCAAEETDEVVQVVVGGVPVRADGRLMVFHRDKDKDKASSYGRTTLWRGCHIVAPSDGLTSAHLEAEMIARFQQELHIRTSLAPQLLGLAAPLRTKDTRHLGVLYTVDLSDDVAQTLHNKVFRSGARTHPFTGQFLSQQELLGAIEDLDLEPWSRHLLENWSTEHA